MQFVYFNAETLAEPARGYNVDQFRAAVVRAIAVWNEESLSGQRMVFMGDGNPPNTPNVIVIHHDWTRDCPPNNLGLAITFGSSSGGGGGPCADGRTITVHLQNCTNPRQELRYSAGLPLSTEYSYEAVIIHELGHAAFGFPEQLDASLGVMSYCNSPSPPYTPITCPGIPTGPVGERLHLHRIDQQTAVDYFGNTTSIERTRAMSSANAWLGSDNTFLPATSFGPSLTTHRLGDATNSVIVGTTNWSQTFPFRVGSAVSWTAIAPIVPAAVASGVSVRPWVSIARSDYGELAVAWAECATLTTCTVRTAWRSFSGSWQVAPNPVAMPVSTRVEVAYDPDLDFFVMFSIHPDGRMFHAFEAAYQPNNWTTPLPLEGFSGSNSNQRFRFMGGAVFYQHPGTPRPQTHGTLFAASATPDNGASTPIMAFDIGYDDASYQYRTSARFFPGQWGQQAAYSTVRNFSVRREWTSNVLVAVWTDDQRPNRIRVARTPDVTFGYLALPTVMASSSTEPIQSSVSLANNIDDASQFVVGWSSP